MLKKRALPAAAEPLKTALCPPWLTYEGIGSKFKYRLSVSAKPCAASTTVALDGDELTMRLAARPEGGKANRELLSYFDDVILRKGCSAARLVAGATSRHKTVAFESDMPPAVLTERLLQVASEAASNH